MCDYKTEGNVALKQHAVGFEGSWRPGSQDAQDGLLEWAGGESPVSLQSEHSCEDTFNTGQGS